MKKILITGSSGFIGRNLKEKLPPKDQLFTPSHKQLDLLKENKVEKYINDNNIKYIIHTAKVGGLRGRDNKETFFKNLQMFFSITKAEKLVNRIIYFGSGAEFDKNRPLKNVCENDFDEKMFSHLKENNLIQYLEW